MVMPAVLTKDGNKNRLRSQDIHKIVDVAIKGGNLNVSVALVPPMRSLLTIST